MKVGRAPADLEDLLVGGLEEAVTDGTCTYDVHSAWREGGTQKADKRKGGTGCMIQHLTKEGGWDPKLRSF